MNRDPILANHILSYISNVERYIDGLTKEEFLTHFMVQDAVTRNVEIIGEACSKMSRETREKFPEIPWHGIIAMRNILIHEYFRADAETIWNVVQHDLPNLKTHVVKILNSFE